MPVEFVAMPQNSKVVVLRDLVLLVFDHRALELLDLSAFDADQVIIIKSSAVFCFVLEFLSMAAPSILPLSPDF